ncbi:hypothetical protein HanPI659440_Chr03g0101791 [Helianthus annuus]|nr:hypothetical protein HanPI659440_Chr03g0101791 [Helianthus annuus]
MEKQLDISLSSFALKRNTLYNQMTIVLWFDTFVGMSMGRLVLVSLLQNNRRYFGSSEEFGKEQQEIRKKKGQGYDCRLRKIN